MERGVIGLLPYPNKYFSWLLLLTTGCAIEDNLFIFYLSFHWQQRPPMWYHDF